MKKDELLNLIIKYNCNKELNNLKDILDYLIIKPLFVFTTIKISKQKLLQIPKDDLLVILDNLIIIDNKQYFSLFSSQEVVNFESKYCLEITILDCLRLMKKMGRVNQIIINPNLKHNLSLDKSIIQYLKR